MVRTSKIDWKDKKQVKEYFRLNHIKNKSKSQEYYKKNVKRIKEIKTKYNKEHPEINQKAKRKWAKKHPQYAATWIKRYRQNHPESSIKIKSYKYARKNHLRDIKCSKCSSTDRLEFHHTNYEKNEGFTLCRKCHDKIHHS